MAIPTNKKNPLDIYAGTDGGLSAGGVPEPAAPAPRPAAQIPKDPTTTYGAVAGANFLRANPTTAPAAKAPPPLARAPAPAPTAPAVRAPAPTVAAPAPARPAAPVTSPRSTMTMGAVAGADFLARNANNPANGPAPAPPAPVAPVKPGGFGRGLGNAVALGVDTVANNGAIGLNLLNKAAVGLRNIGADAVGAKNVQATQLPLNNAQTALERVRKANAAGGAAPAAGTATPATGASAPVGALPGATTPPPIDPRIQPWDSPASAVPSAADAQPAAPTTLRSANGKEEGYFIGSDGQKRTVNVDGTVNGTGAGGPVGGLSVVAQQPGAVAPQPFQPPPSYNAPGVNLGGDLAGAEQERKARLQTIADRLNQLGEPDTHGKRALQAQLLAQQQELTTARYGQQGQLATAGATLANQGAIAAQGLTANAAEGEAQRQATAGELALGRAAQRDNYAQQVVGEDGNAYSVNGAEAKPITVGGKPFKPAPGKDYSGSLTPQNSIDVLKALLDSTDAISNPVTHAKYQAQLAAMIEGQGQGQAAAPSMAEFMLKAKAANPNATDAELTQYYNTNYGQ